MTTQRSLSLLLLLILCVTAVHAQSDYTVHRPHADVLAIYHHRLNGWMVAVRTADGLVLIDSFPSPGEARAVMPEMAAFSDQPVKAIILTHHHWDHVFGAQEFPGATIIAHRNAPGQIQSSAGQIRSDLAQIAGLLPEAEKKLAAATPESDDHQKLAAQVARFQRAQTNYSGFAPLMPTETVGDTDRRTIGGVEFVLRHYGPGHTDNDLVISIPSLELLLPGDLVEHNGMPYLESGGNLRTWATTLAAIERDNPDAKIIIPGHGPISDLSALSQQRHFLEDVIAALDAAIAAGSSLEEAQKSVRLDQYQGFDGYERGFPRLIANFWPNLGGAMPAETK